MAQAAIAADLHESLDVQIDLASEVALYRKVSINVVAQPGDLFIREIFDPRFGDDAYGIDGFPRPRPSDPVDIGQRDLDLLIVGYVYPGDSRHYRPPERVARSGVVRIAPKLTLALLVSRVIADDPHHAVAPDNLALLATWLH
jgi:hypothetical protein